MGLAIAASAPGLITLDDVHAHLNIPASDISHDVELQGFIDAATAAISYATGPVQPTVYSETRDGGSPVIMLDHPPIITVNSVIEYVGQVARTLTAQAPGATVDNYGYSLDDAVSGKLVRRSSAGTPMPFWGGPGAIVITYTAGIVSIPADVRMAALEDLRGLYQQTQQGGAVGGGQIGAGGDDQWNVGPMRLFPRLAMLLDGPGRTQSIA